MQRGQSYIKSREGGREGRSEEGEERRSVCRHIILNQVGQREVWTKSVVTAHVPFKKTSLRGLEGVRPYQSGSVWVTSNSNDGTTWPELTERSHEQSYGEHTTGKGSLLHRHTR